MDELDQDFTETAGLRAHQLTSARFGGPGRAVAYVDTDADDYEPGRPVHVRVLLLGAMSRAPCCEAKAARITLHAPNGVVECEALGTGGPTLTTELALPAEAAEGEHWLSVTFDSVELPSLQKVLRVQRRPTRAAGTETLALRVTLHAESGAALVGVATRLYVEAVRGDAAQEGLRGRIGEGADAVDFVTDGDGRARVTWTPGADGDPNLHLEGDLDVEVSNPIVARDGWALMSRDDVSGADDPVRVRVACAGPARRGRVALAMREWEVASRCVALDADGFVELELTPPSSAVGVLRLVAYDEVGRPRAERLVYRRPARALFVELLADVSAATREVSARVTDADGEPVVATVWWSAIEARAGKTRPSVPATVLLAQEVEAVDDPAGYLEDSVAAALRLDMLLGVQSWRRFGFYRPDEFVGDYGAAAARVLCATWPVAPTTPELRLTRFILEMNDRLAEAKRHVALAIADEKRLGKQQDAEHATVEAWSARAQEAARAGADALAEEARENAHTHARIAAELETQWTQQLQAVASLKASLRALNMQVEEAKRRRNVLVARLQCVEAASALRVATEQVRGGTRRDLDEVERHVAERERVLGLHVPATAPSASELSENAREGIAPVEPTPRVAPWTYHGESSTRLWCAGTTDASGCVAQALDGPVPDGGLRVRLDAVSAAGELGSAEIFIASARA